jgi:hypothetical protein
MDGIVLAQPAGWVDRSMIAFNAGSTPASGLAPNVVVTQDRFGDVPEHGERDRIIRFAEKQIAEIKAKVPQVVLHERTKGYVAGRPAALLLLSWQGGGHRLTQRIAFIHRDTNRVAIFTATAAATDFSEYQARFEQALQSIQFEN